MDRDTESESEGFGHVTYRSRTAQSTSSRERSPLPSLRFPRNNGLEVSYTPIHTNDGRSPGILKSSSYNSVADLLPPEIGSTPKEEPHGNSFKGWLTSGIMDFLGAAAGATLSTTGKLVAPPLHVTKTVLLPGVLALFVDTMDAITPLWVQDWFRILSSSVHHIMVVLGNTEKGQMFSNQVYMVLQDVLQVFSATESRQVLVDAMATSVKFAGALKTQEMKEFLEQLSTLGIRLIDAASSGKAKQLLRDTKDVAWKGIEMAADPSTTLALAEVTAHLCHALEDAQRKLNPTPRKRRDEQNKSIYLNPYQMANFPEQVTMEEVILSCLGRVDDHVRERPEDDVASIQSRLTLDDDLSLHDPEYRDLKDRKDTVNVTLLREKILEGRDPTPSTRDTRSSLHPTANLHPSSKVNLPGKDSSGTADAGVTATLPPEGIRPYEDMEEIDLPGIVGGRRLGLSTDEVTPGAGTDPEIPAVQMFYSKLDELLQGHREQARIQRANKATATASRSTSKARIKKLNDVDIASPSIMDSKRTDIPLLIQKYKVFFLLVLYVGSLVFLTVSGLACYGLYTLVSGYAPMPRTASQIMLPNQEVIVKVIREVVHINEHGEVLGKSDPEVLTKEELEEIGQKVAVLLS